MKKKVILRAPLLTMSGYGVHSRQIFRWLESNEEKFDTFVNVVPWGNTTWFVNPDRLDGLVARIMNKSGNYPSSFDISIQVQLPNEWDSNLARFNVGVTAAVETDKANPAWAYNVNAMDLVIVPSEHAKLSLTNSGCPERKIKVVPEAFIDEILEEEKNHLNIDFDTNFNFLIFGQFTGNNEENDRKNTYNTLKWICESFKNDKDVGIVIKTNFSRNCQFDRNLTKDILRSTLSKFRDERKLPPVYFIHGEMSDREVASLYVHPKIKALVSLTRGEGFGLPTLEAAASGLPIIATNWSGHLDFLNKGKFLEVDYSLKEVSDSRIDKRGCSSCNGTGKNGHIQICSICGGTGFTQIFMEGSKWAEPKEISAKKVLKKFREMPDVPKQWAVDLSTIIRKEYSQDAIQKHYDRVFSDIVV
jgi:hypothetical protein